MKKQQRMKQAFVALLYDMSLGEQCLLLIISKQTKSGSVRDTEGKIGICEEDYLAFTKEFAPYATLNIAVRTLTARLLNAGNNVNWNLIPLVQEVSTCHREAKVFISFNPMLIPYLLEIEKTLNYDIHAAKKIRGSLANRFYALMSQYLNAGNVSFSLKELQEKIGVLSEVEYFSNYSIQSSIKNINDALTNIKIKYKMENNPSEEVNPIFTFSVVKRYD